MVAGDFIAVGILFSCAILSLLGAMKWLLRIAGGIVLGVLIIVGLSLLADHPGFNDASQGVFRQGIIIPSVRYQVNAIGLFGKATQAKYGGKEAFAAGIRH
jgi:hypothetical protein